ncbi:MAG: Rrf2 family transcriptional regulator [Acetobacteraceae bacterium]
MRVTAYTDYSIRVLMYLAVRPDHQARIADIAAAYAISEAHLMKVVHQLGLAGDVQTVRGRNGGIRLAKPASAINLGTVVRRTEADLNLVPCFDAPETCPIAPACTLQGVLHEALDAFLAVLDRYTLADLVVRRQDLSALFAIPPTPAASRA